MWCPGLTCSARRRKESESRLSRRYHSNSNWSLSLSSRSSSLFRSAKSLLSRKHIGGSDGTNVSGDNDGEYSGFCNCVRGSKCYKCELDAICKLDIELACNAYSKYGQRCGAILLLEWVSSGVQLVSWPTRVQRSRDTRKTCLLTSGRAGVIR